MDTGLILSGEKIVKSYRSGDATIRVLDGATITISAGEMVVLFGPSGSGKTTLLHVLAGLEQPDSGSVSVNGTDVYSLSDARRSRMRREQFGFIFQSFNLLSSMSALENVQIPLWTLGRKNARGLAAQVLERVGLAHRMHHRPAELSGGEQQRVAIARALVTQPKMVFADEPTGNLDSSSASSVMNCLVSAVRDSNAGCLLVTHNAQWGELADRVLYLIDGRVEVEPK
ncbi:MAG TPA: ABC transporter ATP-binding protein [Firmicutes bacterium]|nr:ABC transporter ATP-binding protein [Candidatus Fermentithermobacillaceae bacterium]